MSTKHVTINQVAARAAVSIQTVSRVLNGRPDVSPETRQRVQKVIDELGYQPYAIARGLASRRTYTLGLVTVDFTDYWFNQVVTGAEEEARKHGFFFMLGSARCAPEDEPVYLRLLKERHVEGVLFVRAGSADDYSHLRNLRDSGVPVVTTGDYIPEADFSSVDVNNIEGGRKAVRYLIEHGHTRIAMIPGPRGIKSTNDRNLGYYQAMQEAGIVPDPDLVVYGDWTHRSGYEAMRQLLSTGRPLTAIFSHNDRMAIGALSVARAAGLKVPQDISIVGYDDIPEAEFSDPPLTTIRQPTCEVGQAAASLLIQILENPGMTPKQVLLETELVERSSCAYLHT